MLNDFYIDHWLVEPRLNRISSGGETTEIEPLVMQILTKLAERPGDVVSREELMQAVWGDTVVGEKSLTSAISKLRKVFRDDPFEPRIIRTVSKGGYSLIAQLRPAEPSPHSHPELVSGSQWVQPKATVKQARAGRQRGVQGEGKRPRLDRAATAILPLAAIVILAMVAGLLAWTARSDDPTASPIHLTSTPGHEINPGLSPDGRFVAFAWAGSDGTDWDIYIQQVGSGEPLRRTTDSAIDLQPVWSPDAAQIAFTRYTELDCGIFLMPALAGEPYRISDCAGSIAPGGFVFFRPNLTWSPDGSSIVFPFRDTTAQAWSLFSLSLESLELRPLTNPAVRFGGDFGPKFSPNGKSIAFARLFGYGGADLFVLDVASGEERRLTFDSRAVLGIDWMEDGRDVIFSSERDGTFDLWRIPSTGGRPRWVPAAGQNLKEPRIRPGGRLVYENWLYDSNLWKLDLSTPGDPHGPAEPERLLGSTLREIHPQYSTDGSRITFVSNRSGSYEIWIAESDGSNETQITEMGGPIVGSPRWSKDDSRIVFEIWREEQADLHFVELETRGVTRLTNDPADDMLGSWSDDGNRLTFTSNRSGDWQIWTVGADGSDIQQITTDGGYGSHFEPGRAALLYSRQREAGLWRARLDADPISFSHEVVIDDLEPGDWRNWVPTHDGIYYAVRAPAPGIGFFDAALDSTRILRTMNRLPSSVRSGFTIDPVGPSMVFSKIDQTEADLMMMAVD